MTKPSIDIGVHDALTEPPTIKVYPANGDTDAFAVVSLAGTPIRLFLDLTQGNAAALYRLAGRFQEHVNHHQETHGDR